MDEERIESAGLEPLLIKLRDTEYNIGILVLFFYFPKTQGKQEPITNSLFMSRVGVNVNLKVRCK